MESKADCLSNKSTQGDGGITDHFSEEQCIHLMALLPLVIDCVGAEADSK